MVQTYATTYIRRLDRMPDAGAWLQPSALGITLTRPIVKSLTSPAPGSPRTPRAPDGFERVLHLGRRRAGLLPHRCCHTPGRLFSQRLVGASPLEIPGPPWLAASSHGESDAEHLAWWP